MIRFPVFVYVSTGFYLSMKTIPKVIFIEKETSPLSCCSSLRKYCMMALKKDLKCGHEIIATEEKEVRWKKLASVHTPTCCLQITDLSYLKPNAYIY